MVTQITAEFASFLSEIATRLNKVIKPVGRIDHSFWREFRSEKKSEPTKGFIDGDLIEAFLDLSRDKMEEVVNGLQVGMFTCIKVWSNKAQ